MTDEQMAAVEAIKEIARTNNLVVAAICSEWNVVNYYNENEDKLTLKDCHAVIHSLAADLSGQVQETGRLLRKVRYFTDMYER